ncbi:hypothetical protein IEZ28_01330 [Aerococcaceae bacterium zg-1292]|uniref:hypothetical protein n=1 Tax=Aerococcaceae bacterium zg-1292 TaxID=2774330 RepID=UPI0019BB8035|nr:hypothetical protein [Aerococcaceae bacterium zg-1292]
MKTNKLKSISSKEVQNYILTVAWRILSDDLDKEETLKNDFSRPLFERFRDELGQYLLTVEKNRVCKPPKKFRNYVFKLSSLIRNNKFEEITKHYIFGYVMYFEKSGSISVIVSYSGLVFVTDYIFDDKDNPRIIIIRPRFFKGLIRKREIANEIEYLLGCAESRKEQQLTEGIRIKIEERYKSE